MKNKINGEQMTMRKIFQGEIGRKHPASTVQSGMHRRASTVQRTLHSVMKNVSVVIATHKLWHT